MTEQKLQFQEAEDEGGAGGESQLLSLHSADSRPNQAENQPGNQTRESNQGVKPGNLTENQPGTEILNDI